MAGLQSVQIKETKYPEIIVTIKCNILHSDFQNGRAWYLSVFISREEPDFVSYTLRWTTTGVCFLYSQGCQLVQESDRALQVRGCSLELRSFWPVTQKQQQEQILKTLS